MAGTRTEVDDPVRVRHDRLVVFDHDHRPALVDESVEQAEQLVDIREVQARRRLVQDEDAALATHVRRELQALTLTARQRGQRLADRQVPESDVDESAQDPCRCRQRAVAVGEERVGVRHRHGEHLADVQTGVVQLQDCSIEPPPFAHLAHRRDARHGDQVGVDHAGAVAVRAGTIGVRAEEPGLDPVGLGERLADRVEQTRVGGGVAAARALDRSLVDGHDAHFGPDRPADERPFDQRALSGPRHAGHHDEHPERHVDVDVAQVVRRRASDLQRTGRVPHGRLHRRPVVQVPTGDGVAVLETLHGAFEADRAARSAGPGTQVDDVIGDRDRLRLVLDDEDGVALVAQLEQQPVHPLDVVGVQAGGRLVEHVSDIGERRAQMADHPRPLRLSARQGAGGTVQAEVAESDVDERVERPLQVVHDGSDRRVRDAAQPLGEVGDLHRAHIGDVHALDP